MDREPVPEPQGSRERIPPLPPTAVGVMESPGFGPRPFRALEPRVSLWARFRVFLTHLLRR